jgi:hypothetical protein
VNGTALQFSIAELLNHLICFACFTFRKDATSYMCHYSLFSCISAIFLALAYFKRRYFGRLQRRRVLSYSFGLLCTEGAGWSIGDGVMGYKIATLASFAIKWWRRWITSSWAAFLARKCGQHA